MKQKLILAVIIIVMITSCPLESYEKTDSLFQRDTTPPVLLSFNLTDNRNLSFHFSESCYIEELHVGSMFVPHSDVVTEWHHLSMFSEIAPGTEEVLKLTVKDKAGNTSRYWTRIAGINLNVPDTLITEVSAAGTQTSPDRIELTFLSDGTTDGLCIMDGAIGEEKHRFYLPSLSVRKNDIAVIWWDREPKNRETIKRDRNKTYILYAGSPDTLSSTNGSVVLYSHTNGDGKLMDALLWNKSDATLADGFGNARSRNTYHKMVKAEEWKNGTVHSDRITSSRVFSRYTPYEDTNESRDWYISAPRESSFGYPTNNREFIEEK